MGAGYQINNQYALHFVTFTIVDWVDLFSRKVYKDIMVDSLKYCSEHKQLLIYAYVIMSNHVHLIIQPNGKIPLSDIIRDCKKFTARTFIKTIQEEPESRRNWLLYRFKYNASFNQRNVEHQVWIQNNHAIEISSQKFFKQKQDYIHHNPVKAGYVDFPEDYIYSSAYELAGRGNKLDITLF